MQWFPRSLRLCPPDRGNQDRRNQVMTFPSQGRSWAAALFPWPCTRPKDFGVPWPVEFVKPGKLQGRASTSRAQGQWLPELVFPTWSLTSPLSTLPLPGCDTRGRSGESAHPSLSLGSSGDLKLASILAGGA